MVRSVYDGKDIYEVVGIVLAVEVDKLISQINQRLDKSTAGA